MQIQILNFNLRDLGHEEFLKMCVELAPVFAGLPGLVSKVWLGSRETNTYGGVYTWESAEAMADFSRSDLFEQLRTHPHLENLTVREFGVLEAPSRVTRGLEAAPV